MLSAPTFYVVPGSTVKRVLEDNKKQVFDVVEAAYRLHGSGDTLNPESYFLRYPDRPDARIIALPAHVCGRCSAMQRMYVEGRSAATFDPKEPGCSFVISVAFDYPHFAKSEVSITPTHHKPRNLPGSRGVDRLYESEKSPPDPSGVNAFCHNGHHDHCSWESRPRGS